MFCNCISDIEGRSFPKPKILKPIYKISFYKFPLSIMAHTIDPSSFCSTNKQIERIEKKTRAALASY